MRKRFFLFLLGSLLPPAITGGAALGGCGSVIEAAPPSGGHHGGQGGGGGSGGEPPDGAPDYVDPGCPDAGPKTTIFGCDPFNQGNGDCPPGQGCYIFSDPPQTPCGEEIYGSTCAPQGPGGQGADCDGDLACSAGFACVVSGSGNQCTQLCQLEGSSGCPDGEVCEPIDVQGFGGCL